VSGKEGRELAVIVRDTHLPLVLDSIAAAKHIERERQGYGFTARGDKERMRLSISNWWSSEKPGPSWEDETGAPIERRLRDIAAAIILFGEQFVRDHAAQLHAWRIERKAELEDAERKRKAEEERRRQERLARLEKARIDHLLEQARFQAVFLHQPHDALSANPNLLLNEIFVHARTAVPLLTFLERGADEHLQSTVISGMPGLRTPAPPEQVIYRQRPDSPLQPSETPHNATRGHAYLVIALTKTSC
jgi:hypothetical protein